MLRRIVLFVCLMILGVVTAVYNAWLIKDLWNWFASPAFGVGEIGTALAFGVMLLVNRPFINQSLVLQWDKAVERATKNENWEAVDYASAIARPILSLIHI